MLVSNWGLCQCIAWQALGKGGTELTAEEKRCKAYVVLIMSSYITSQNTHKRQDRRGEASQVVDSTVPRYHNGPHHIVLGPLMVRAER